MVTHNEEIAHNKTISGTKITELKHLTNSTCKSENLVEIPVYVLQEMTAAALQTDRL